MKDAIGVILESKCSHGIKMLVTEFDREKWRVDLYCGVCKKVWFVVYEDKGKCN